MASAAFPACPDDPAARSRPPEIHPAECHDLLEHALRRLLEGRERSLGLLVIVAQGPAAASRSFDAFLARRDTGGVAATARTNAAVWNADSLGHALTAADRPSRLTDICTDRPLVVVDDLDRLRGRDCQNRFANLLDEAADLGTTFCVSIERPPAAAKNLEPRLASRLCAGLVVSLAQPPGATFPGESCGRGRPGNLSLRRVFRVAARHHELDVQDLVGPSRRRAVATARSLAMYLARVLTSKSLYAIGSACGDRDHTTVMHGVRVMERRLQHDAAFSAEVARLITELRGTTPDRRAGRRRRRGGSVDPVSDTTVKPCGS